MKRLDGWKFTEVIEFVKLHGFIFDHQIPGSHEFWIKEGSTDTMININYTSGTYPIRTLETIIGQSCIEKQHWIKYTELSSSMRKKKLCCK